MNLETINKELANKPPEEIILWGLSLAKKPVLTTNFRPYESAILHAVSKLSSQIKVIWCDTGYNTPQTYKHADQLIKQLKLNIEIYVPKQSVAYRDVIMGIPEIGDENHQLFSNQVKLEPFKRAMKANQPDVWFTNLRKGQTAFRDSIDVVSMDKNGAIKICPFYNWSDSDLDSYLKENQLTNEFKYYDPTKVLGTRECGIHS